MQINTNNVATSKAVKTSRQCLPIRLKKDENISKPYKPTFTVFNQFGLLSTNKFHELYTCTVYLHTALPNAE